MRRNLRRTHLLAFLGACFLMAMAVRMSCGYVQERSFVCLSTLSVTDGDDKQTDGRQQSLSEGVVKPSPRQHYSEATLSDATHLYRICSSRPQRVLPSQGSKTERSITPFQTQLGRQSSKPLYSYHNSRCRQETAPFCMSVSRIYYVIALRHLIC